MVVHRISAPATPVPLDFDAIRAELEVPGPFPGDALAEAERAAKRAAASARDATDIEFVSIDPPGSLDLDQAVHVERTDGRWRVHYAIADLGAWIDPGSPLDIEARLRTQTFYAPDINQPLHPRVLSEGAASLLPDGDRPAVLWTIDVDDDGSTRAIAVERAFVRNRAALTYAEVQAAFDAGEPPDAVSEMRALGEALLDDARRRKAIDLGLPEQEVVPDGDGHWTIRLRADRPVELWNAQISLLTGRAAASLMLDAGIGILRTLPSADPSRIPPLRSAAIGLGIAWADDDHPGDVLARLDTSRPRHAAFADLAAELLRGAGYTAFTDGAPANSLHAGVGAAYAHVTAPLRRLVDRFGTEVVVSVAAGRTVPEWVAAALPQLPDLMQDGDRRSKALDRSVVDATEAFVLADRVGEVFTAAVVESGDDWGTVAIDQPAVRGRCETPDLPLGDEIHVRCTVADIAARTVRFERVDRP